ncbi:MAG: hypothetical protein Unbinned6224contig1003_52 [Prokaryotic dsDNA virus sp.]|nr:MAG: hypothetical protein Unbinned6224contig1003_52 [Prokaryotic dsDNA virus sp.]|tara:strand:+ start:32984 stop:33526 length:543 start_codon:yes stop_codon:yes gene_type:complete
MASLELVKSATSTSNADIFSITDCFTADYDVYKVVYVYEDDSGVANNTFVRLLDSSNNAINDTFTYNYASRGLNGGSGVNFDVRNQGQNEIFISYLPDRDLSLGKQREAVLYVYSPYDATSFTFLIAHSWGLTTSNEFLSTKAIGTLSTAGTHKGIQVIHVGSGNGVKSGATINVWGYKR